MAGISYEYKIGVKREIVSALRKVFQNYPDPQMNQIVSVVDEYPLKEVHYPMIIVRFRPTNVRNIGFGHYELDYDSRGLIGQVLHWTFEGTVEFDIYALSPLDRDKILVGLVNLLAFGQQIPAFQDFANEIRDYDFVAIQMPTDEFQEGGDSVVSVPWQDDEEPVFTNSISIPIFGEFFTQPATGDLIEISRVNLFPYQPDQQIPQGSQAVIGSPGDPDYKDDRTVGWGT